MTSTGSSFILAMSLLLKLSTSYFCQAHTRILGHDRFDIYYRGNLQCYWMYGHIGCEKTRCELNLGINVLTMFL